MEDFRLTDPKYHHGNLKQALIEAGLNILNEGGLEALSIRACAARAGVSHGAPKNHFSTLAVLQAAIVTEGFRMFAAQMTDYMDRAQKTPKAQVMACAKGYIDFAETNAPLFRLMFSMERKMDLYPDLLPASRDSYAILRRVSKFILPENCENPVDQTTIESMLWTIVHGYANLKANRQFYTSNAERGEDPAFEDIFPKLRYVEGPTGMA